MWADTRGTWRTIWSEAIKRVKAGVDPMSTAAQPSSYAASG